MGQPRPASGHSSRPDPDPLGCGVRAKSVVAQVTRTVRNIGSEVRLSILDGMRQVNGDVLITVERPLFLKYITTLSSARMAEVHDALRFALELP